MITAFAVFTSAYAQTVQPSKAFENTYFSVYGGVTTTGQFSDVVSPFFWDGAKAVANGVRPMVGVELGKYITPSVGYSVEGIGFFNTTTSTTFFDESAVVANGKLNISNWLGGYKGQPRRIELVGFAGLGWGHDFVGEGQTWTSEPNDELDTVYGINTYNDELGRATDKNYLVYNAGLELNFNLGKARAWQVNVKPSIMFFNKANEAYQSIPTMADARATVQVGVTYKFGSKSKNSHNFVLCPYSVTKAELDAALAKIHELENREPVVKEVVKTVIETKETIIKGDTRVLVGSTVITFPIRTAELTKVEKQKVGLFAKSLDNDTLIQIVGSADSKTGTEGRNFVLANSRANVVKNVLVSDYGISADRIAVNVKLDATDSSLSHR